MKPGRHNVGAVTTVPEVPEDHTVAAVGAKLPMDPNLMGMMQQLLTRMERLEARQGMKQQSLQPSAQECSMGTEEKATTDLLELWQSWTCLP